MCAAIGNKLQKCCWHDLWYLFVPSVAEYLLASLTQIRYFHHQVLTLSSLPSSSSSINSCAPPQNMEFSQLYDFTVKVSPFDFFFNFVLNDIALIYFHDTIWF